MSHLLKLKIIPVAVLILGLASLFMVKPVLAYTNADYTNLVASMTTAQKQELISVYNSVSSDSTITVTALKGKVDGLTTFDSNAKNVVKNRIDSISQDTGKTTFSKSDVNTAFGTLSGSDSSSSSSSTTDSTSANSFSKITPEVVIAQLVTIVFIFVAMIVWLAVDIVLVGRWVMIAFLAVLSPLPFILMILPATKKYAQMWWSKFVKWATVGVLITFCLWLVPQVLATKNDKGYWEKKTITAWSGPASGFGNWLNTGEYDDTSKLNVIYPSFLGTGGSAADFFETFVMFCLGIGFMIAGAWVAITLGETAGKIALSIPRFLKNTAKGAGKLAAKAAWQGTGIPGAAKQRWADTMGQRKARAEARRERLMGGKVLGEKLVGGGLKNLTERGVRAEDALRFAKSGQGADGKRLNEFDQIANYIHGAPAIGDDYDALQSAENHMRRLGASERTITQFEAAARDNNPLALYNLRSTDPAKSAEEHDRLERDYKANPELFHRLLSKQKSIPGGVLDMVGRIGGKKAVRDLIKPYNRNNLLEQMEEQISRTHADENYIISDDLRETFAGETGKLDFAFSRRMSPKGNPVLMTDKATKFLDSQTYDDMKKMQFSPKFMEETWNKITPAALQQMASAGGGVMKTQYVNKLKSYFNKVRARAAFQKTDSLHRLATREGRPFDAETARLTKDDLRAAFRKDHFFKGNPLLVEHMLNHYIKF